MVEPLQTLIAYLSKNHNKPYGDVVMESIKTTSLVPAITESGAIASNGDDTTLHKLGLAFQECTELGKVICLKQAVILWEARKIHVCRGRDGQFSFWLNHYCPEMNRRQADRLANIVELFTSGNLDNLAKFERLIEHFKISALYQLASPSIPASAREEALLQAEGGRTITPGIANELIAKHTVPSFALDAAAGDATRTKRERSKTKTIQVEGGAKVTIRCEDGNVVNALKMALKQLERASQTTK